MKLKLLIGKWNISLLTIKYQVKIRSLQLMDAYREIAIYRKKINI